MEAGTETTAMRSPASENGETGEGARAKAEEVAGKAQEQVGTAKDKARVQLRDQVDQRSTQAGERVRSAAGDARSVAEELRKQGSERPARYAEQAADQAERVGDWLRDSDGDRILGDVEDFARRNPWGVAVAGLALGFVAARMLKASSAERYERSTGARPQLPSTGARGGP